jgi:hypothetical protein
MRIREMFGHVVKERPGFAGWLKLIAGFVAFGLFAFAIVLFHLPFVVIGMGRAALEWIGLRQKDGD